MKAHQVKAELLNGNIETVDVVEICDRVKALMVEDGVEVRNTQRQRDLIWENYVDYINRPYKLAPSASECVSRSVLNQMVFDRLYQASK